MILKVNGTWTLSSELVKGRYLLSESTEPIGRRVWINEDGHNLTLTLTTCTETQFSGNDGQCLNAVQRCDELVDLEDKSDEHMCKEGLVKKTDSYNKDHGPNFLFNYGPNKTDVDVQMEFLAFGDYEISSRSIRANFDLRVHWKDPRLSFRYLSSNSYTRHLSCDEIWKPDLGFVEIIHSEERDMLGFAFEGKTEKSCSIRTKPTGIEEQQDVNDNMMGKAIIRFFQNIVEITKSSLMFHLHSFSIFF